jgi:hypothetical protein
VGLVGLVGLVLLSLMVERRAMTGKRKVATWAAIEALLLFHFYLGPTQVHEGDPEHSLNFFDSTRLELLTR